MLVGGGLCLSVLPLAAQTPANSPPVPRTAPALPPGARLSLPPPAPTPPRAPAEPGAAAPAAATGARQMLEGPINFQGAPLSAVLDFYARLTNRSIISAPNTSSVTIFFRSQTDLTKDEALAALDSVLSINGIAVVPLGDKFSRWSKSPPPNRKA